jgi:hypothetical protein
LFQNIAADGEVFVGDAIRLKENSFRPRLRGAFGDDFSNGTISSQRAMRDYFT